MMIRSCTYLAILVTAMLLTSCSLITQGWVNKERQAIAVPDDHFGDSAVEIVYADQNWNRWQSLWFYNTSQGSDLIPLDIFLHLEQENSNEKFRDNKNMLRFRYLTQEKSWDNKYGLPVGWVVDAYKNRYKDLNEEIDDEKMEYIGFTCAACHTTQINYKNGTGPKVGIRIDGGPGMGDMETALMELQEALKASLSGQKFLRLYDNIARQGSKETELAFRKRLDQVELELRNYNDMNKPVLDGGNGNVDYGYARLDAFGRIYNRVLEHIAPPGEFDYRPKLPGTPPEKSRFRPNPANAPVSYPFLWDTPQHDFVQWNGVGDNASGGGLGPLGRNTGEVIGVFATFEVKKKRGWWRKLRGKEAKKGSYSYSSSARTRNLVRLERRIKSLESPSWKQLASKGYLPVIQDGKQKLKDKVPKDRVTNGEKIFKDYICGRCHEVINRKSHAPDDANKPQMVIAQFASLKEIGTDDKMAANAKGYCGQAGILMDADQGSCEDPRQVKALAALTTVTSGVLLEGILRSVRSIADVAHDFFFNKTVTKYGSSRQVDLETGNKGYLNAYKGRPLNGIWATAPYLHNGSVQNLYELFLPSECSGTHNTPGETCRSKSFKIGSREFDPERVGFAQSNEPGLFEFDTTIKGNSNAGHEYVAGITRVPVLVNEKGELDNKNGKPKHDANGNIEWTKLPPLSDKEQLLDLVEYLKTL